MIIICGPTGVGKSDFAELLAQQASGEIINMDLGQFYTPLSIGTAKPNWRNAAIRHHLFDILDTPAYFTVVAYRQRLLETCDQLWQRGILPIVVGGSAFYLKSLLFPPGEDAALLEMSHTHYTWQDLHAIDPDRAAALHQNDTYRLNRAMQIWHATGRKPSLQQPHFSLPCNIIVLCVSRDRAELYNRINERVIMMMQAGWLDEVKSLLHTPWESFLRDKKLIGYNELVAYCSAPTHARNLDDTISIIQQRTRHYAKRQETFLRGLKKSLDDAYAHYKDGKNVMEIRMVNLTLLDVNLYIKQLLNALKSL